MSFLKMQAFRGIAKKTKFTFSTPQKIQRVIYHSESGTLSHESLPIFVGFMSAETDTVKKGWKAEHILRLKVLKNGEPVQDDTVLVICDRTFMPLDPLGILNAKDQVNRKSLDDIGGNIHDQEVIDLSKKDESINLANTIITGCFIIDALCIFAKYLMSRG